MTNLNDIIKQASFVVVGDMATRPYMPERMTLDLDILIRDKNAQLVYEDLEKANGQKVGDEYCGYAMAISKVYSNQKIGKSLRKQLLPIFIFVQL